MMEKEELLVMLILIFILSFVPAIAIYLWLRKRKQEDTEYRRICSQALKRGLFQSTAVVFVVATLFYIIQKIMALLGCSPVICAIYHNVVMFAFTEEMVKYCVLERLIKKNPYPYSWLDIISLMMIIAIGFEIMESVTYAIGSNAGMMIVRGATAMHCGYGFIMGYFVGKAMETGKKKYTLIGFLIPFLMHAVYDCSLSDTLLKINERLGYVALALAIVSLVLWIFAIVYIHKIEKKDQYIKPLM